MSARAVVLLSGGLDSVTAMALAGAQGRQVYALSFSYGQRHALELGCARRQAKAHGVAAHEVVDLSHLGRLVAPATALVADSAVAVPKDRAPAADIPVTYVPARNLLFLSYALAWAETVQAPEIWIGVNALDYSGYPDCRPAFVEAFARTANLATRVGVLDEAGDAVKVRTPLMQLHKHEIVARGVALRIDYADTLSCYDPTAGDGGRAQACGRCDSCTLRREGFARAGVDDPTVYVDA